MRGYGPYTNIDICQHTDLDQDPSPLRLACPLCQDLGEREGVVQGGEARLRSLQAQAESRERELDLRERAVLELQQTASGERQVGGYLSSS